MLSSCLARDVLDGIVTAEDVADIRCRDHAGPSRTKERTMSDEGVKGKILEHLAGLPGKGVEVPGHFISKLGVKRREVMKVLRELEEEGKIETAGAAAGVIGYKLKK